MLDFTERISKFESNGSDPLDVTDYPQSLPARHHTKVAKNILVDIMKFRRASGSQMDCPSSPCEKCIEPHLSKILSSVEKGHPITFVLPAFPGKSPNPAKVLGTLPDMAERQALEFLQRLCDRVRQYYSPGANIIICSDGRVFSDVVGLRDEDVTAYQGELSRIIAQAGLTSLSTFDLDDVYADLNFHQMRTQLMEKYGEPLENIKAAISRGKMDGCAKNDKAANQLYCGITRFLVEDGMIPGQSRTAIQKEARLRAYFVIQRSKAWGDWVEAQFPHAIRLSIHPQLCGSNKLGIRLIEPDHWMTPWHGVAVEVNGRFMLLKRFQAEQLGAQLVHLEGRPSHYVLKDERVLSNLQGVRHGA